MGMEAWPIALARLKSAGEWATQVLEPLEDVEIDVLLAEFQAVRAPVSLAGALNAVVQREGLPTLRVEWVEQDILLTGLNPHAGCVVAANALKEKNLLSVVVGLHEAAHWLHLCEWGEPVLANIRKDDGLRVLEEILAWQQALAWSTAMGLLQGEMRESFFDLARALVFTYGE